MFGGSVKRQERRRPGDLFARIGSFLHAQGLPPDPANYAFAHHLLSRDDAEAAAIIARIDQDGVRLTGREIEALGGQLVGVSGSTPPHPAQRACDDEGEAERLVVQTRVHADAVATIVRAMHDETRGFGRDLAESAAALGAKGVRRDSGEIVRLTTSMIQRVADAEGRLANATREADRLRAELVEAQASARCDPLTGLPNRRAFEEAFAALDPAGRHCVALCDIDRFKRINDEFGHAVGDRVLRSFAQLLSEQCPGQLVTRQGGEEFAVLLPGAEVAHAAAILEDARGAAAARRLRDRDSSAPIGQVTFSAGVVAIAAGESAEAALVRADRLLYRAKATGRDCIVAG